MNFAFFFFKEFISDSLSTDVKAQRLADLGVQFRRFDSTVAWHLKVFNKLSYLHQRLDEIPESKAPKPLSDDFEYQLRRQLRQKMSA